MMVQSRLSRTALLAMGVLSVSWGLGYCLTRSVSGDVAPFQQLTVQSIIALLALTVLWRREPGAPSFLPRPTRRVFVILQVRGLVGGVGGVFLLITAAQLAPLSHIAWLQALPLTVFWAMIFHGERLTFSNAVCLATGVFGVALMVLPTAGGALRLGLGELSALAANAVFALGLVLGRGAVNELGREATARWTTFLMAFYGVAGMLFAEGLPNLPSPAVSALLAAGGLLWALNGQLSLFGFSHLPAAVATGILNLECVWAPVFALMLFGELPSTHGTAGGIIVVGSSLAMARWGRAGHAATEPEWS